ncbi:MAG: thiamine biosynthesis protein ThiF [Halobacteriovoraceae bacterium]|nr:thiamine biosynthesis protein ThiF [Halobacteriovoraceae bacterium]|tara:strand:+ start:11083 stop:11955 length:873 start_codon:yes stop_codon:yes gene_type:complete
MNHFDYNEFTTRNIGFVDASEQLKLKNAKVFVAGVGGMGGVAIALLARSGVGELHFADIDTFEISNFNRQVFASLDSLDEDKAEFTQKELLKINPDLKIKRYGSEWILKLSSILDEVDFVINGCDDIKATLTLMRAAKDKNKTVIDAFASTLPSVYVIKPNDPRPEKTFQYPSLGRPLDQLSEEDLNTIVLKEIQYVMTHSSSANHVVLKHAIEMARGERSRMSFAPMVWMTGCLMSYEATKLILGYKNTASYKGIFYNPWKFRVEKPLPKFFAMIKGFAVRKYFEKVLK